MLEDLLDLSEVWYYGGAVLLVVILYLFWKSYSSSRDSETRRVVPLSTPTAKGKKPINHTAPETVDDPSLHPLKIFFASQTGTAEDFARKLAIESKRYKFKAQVIDLEDYDPEELSKEKFVMFMAATYGEGEPTDNSRDFSEWLMDDSREESVLEGVKFTVFGLGNKTYEHYNYMGRQFDKRLSKLGAERVYERGEGDDDSSLEDDFAAWKKNMWPEVCKKLGIEAPAEGAVVDERKYKLEIYQEGSPKYSQAKKRVSSHLCRRPGLGEG